MNRTDFELYENSDSEPVKIRWKTDLVSQPACGVALIYIQNSIFTYRSRNWLDNLIGN